MAENPKKTPAPQEILDVPEISGWVPLSSDVKDDFTGKLDQSGPNKNSTRQNLAYLYVGAFLIIIMLTLIVMFFRSYSINDIKDVLLTESGILSGPLGFIMGFYFKEELERKK